MGLGAWRRKEKAGGWKQGDGRWEQEDEVMSLDLFEIILKQKTIYNYDSVQI
jgi:hypothetical protein